MTQLLVKIGWLSALILLLTLPTPDSVSLARSTLIGSVSQQNQINAALPLAFEPNVGQADTRTQFMAYCSGYTLSLGMAEMRVDLQNVRTNARGDRQKRGGTQPGTLSIELVGAHPIARGEGVEQLQGRSNYLIGNDPKRWRINVPHYAKIRYDDVYPGVSLVIYGNETGFEYDFVVAPGADPKGIRLAFKGGQQMQIDQAGDLVLRTNSYELRQAKPVIYQEVEGGRKLIAGRYARAGKQEIRFAIAEYDRSRPLIIDPVLTYSTYLGGTSDDTAAGMAIDAEGNTYITGNTASTDFPRTPGGLSAQCNNCAFVTKLNASGTALVYSTFIGPATSRDIAVDAAGQVYLTGNAETGFPTTPGAYRTAGGGAFVTKLNATGSALVYSTFLGPATANGIALDSGGNAYVTGAAGAGYPATTGSFQSSASSCLPFVIQCVDAFVTKLNPSGTGLVYSTFVGGNDTDIGNDIAVDLAGQSHITGITYSFDYPIANAFQSRKGGLCTGSGGEPPCGPDVLVTKLNAAGSGLIYSTYLGGSNVTGTSGGPGTETGLAIAVDAFGNAYITGNTDSFGFPTTPGAFQRNYTSGASRYFKDAFITKVSPTGALVYSTYLGSNEEDSGEGIAVDSAGNAYVTGGSRSSSFPLANALPITNGIGVFLTEINQTGSALVFSTYLGIGRTDTGNGVAVDAAGRIYVAGTTPSYFPTTPGALLTDNPGGYNGFATKLTPDAKSGMVANISAASYIGLALAPDSIAAAFGTDLAVATLSATTLPLPLSLAGTTVKIKDGAGAEVTAPLIFVSPNQVNYLVPPQIAAGTATTTITSSGGKVATGVVQIQRVAPGIFAANANGQGVAAAVALRIKADGSYVYEPVAQYDPALGKFIPLPLNLRVEDEQVFLLLFGTGIRGRNSASAVKVQIAGAEVPVTYAGAQTEFAGLDQVNVRLPQSLAGRGEVEVILLAEGYTANAVRISVN